MRRRTAIGVGFQKRTGSYIRLPSCTEGDERVSLCLLTRKSNAIRPHQNRTLHEQRERDGPRTQTSSQERLQHFYFWRNVVNKHTIKHYKAQKTRGFQYYMIKNSAPSSISAYPRQIYTHITPAIQGLGLMVSFVKCVDPDCRTIQPAVCLGLGTYSFGNAAECNG